MKDVKELTDKELISVLNRGINGNSAYWNAAAEEARRRKIYFKN